MDKLTADTTAGALNEIYKAADRPVGMPRVWEMLGEHRTAWYRWVRGERSPTEARVRRWLVAWVDGGLPEVSVEWTAGGVVVQRKRPPRYELSTGDHNETDSTLGEFVDERFDSYDDALGTAAWLNEHFAGIGDPLRARVVEVDDESAGLPKSPGDAWDICVGDQDVSEFMSNTDSAGDAVAAYAEGHEFFSDLSKSDAERVRALLVEHIEQTEETDPWYPCPS